MKCRLFSLLLCLALTCSGLSLADAQNDPVAVQVGAATYPLSEVQGYWDNLAASCLTEGESIGSDEFEQYEQSIIESYVKMGVLENKLAEFGLDTLSAEDEATIEANAQARYDQQLETYAAQIMQQYGRTAEEARAYAQPLMELDGVTMEQARTYALSAFKEQRILDYATGDVPMPTDAEVEAFYEENLVQPCRESYADNIEAFETDVALYGAVSYYYPDGYRYVRHILLPASEGVLARANAQETLVNAAQADVTTAENALYGVQVLEEDDTAATLALTDAKAALAEEQAKLQAIYDECTARYADDIADIQVRLASGESFDSVRADYAADAAMPAEGYLVSKQSVLWATSFRDGAMALQSIGNVSAPVSTNAGVHFIQYVGDAPSGRVPLEGKLKQKIADAAWLQSRYNALEALVAQWRGDYDITTHIELLSVPDCLR